jgi:hypothetical protein
MEKLPRKNTRAGIADQKLKGKVGSKHRLLLMSEIEIITDGGRRSYAQKLVTV